MNNISDTAMVLAAGKGTRLRPLTLAKPKPLFEVGGRTMLDRMLDHLLVAGIKRAVINCFYLAEQIETHLAQRRDIEIIISRETELLDTGGGIKNALAHFGGLPFLALNADLPWRDGAESALMRLQKFWDAGHMDAALLLLPTVRAKGFGPAPRGDFMLEPDGRVWRQNAPVPRSHVWISAQILRPEVFVARAEKVFSTNLIWDAAEQAGRLYGIEHSGTCFHVGTPEDLAEANHLLASGQGWG